MAPKEKAEELIRKYYTFGINKEGQTLSWLESKQCALIAVDEMYDIAHRLDNIDTVGYLLEVIQEIEKQ